MVIHLSADQEARLTAIAAQKGRELDEYVEDILSLAIADEARFEQALSHSGGAKLSQDDMRRQIEESAEQAHAGNLEDGEAVFERLFSRIDAFPRER